MAIPYQQYRAHTSVENTQVAATFKYAAECAHPHAIGQDHNTAWIKPITNPRFAPEEGPEALTLYQAHQHRIGETAKEVATRHLFDNIVRVYQKFGAEAKYLYSTDTRSQSVPENLQYTWAGYKPQESPRFLRSGAPQCIHRSLTGGVETTNSPGHDNH